MKTLLLTAVGLFAGYVIAMLVWESSADYFGIGVVFGSILLFLLIVQAFKAKR